MRVIDLRSDTVTQPSPAMRRCMASAEVGDDVFGEDPTVRRLEERAAALVGKASGLLVTSGTQGNLVALLTLGRRGDAVLLGREAHIAIYEGGGLAVLGGLMPYTLDDATGLPEVAAVRAEIQPPDVHRAPRRLLCLENTHNRRGGLAVPPEAFAAVAAAGREGGLSVHLDGARLFNACARWGVPATAYTAHVDTVQLCLSKGLGAPMGSVLCGSAEVIGAARHWRKRLGGGMRQAGVIAAAGLMALEEHRERLAEDHANALRLAELLTASGVAVEPSPWRTNMVFFGTPPGGLTAAEVAARCVERGVRLLAMGPSRLRAVTHLDVASDAIAPAASVIAAVLAGG